MVDHLNGTYTYELAVDRPGSFTVAVMLYVHGHLYAEYFNSTSFSYSGTHAYSDNPSSIDFVWN